MLRGIFIFIFFLFNANIAFAQGYKGVAELLLQDNIDMNDKYNQSIIMQRCAGVFGALSKFWPIEETKQKEDFFNKSMQLLTVSIALMAEKRGVAIDNSSVSDQVTKAFEIYVDIYHGHIEKTQIATGSIFDEFFKTELQFCSQITG